MTDTAYPEILSDLADRAVELLVTEGRIAEAEAERLARLLADRIGRDWAGQQVYIGKGSVILERDREIYARFNGQNHHILARQYDLTERQVYKIIRRERERRMEERQLSLFKD